MSGLDVRSGYPGTVPNGINEPVLRSGLGVRSGFREISVFFDDLFYCFVLMICFTVLFYCLFCAFDPVNDKG